MTNTRTWSIKITRIFSEWQELCGTPDMLRLIKLKKHNLYFGFLAVCLVYASHVVAKSLTDVTSVLSKTVKTPTYDHMAFFISRESK